MSERIAIKHERVRTRIGAFLLPCALMLAVFAILGVYPFGEKSLLIIDMNSEYVDYLAQMNESLRTGGSLLRSWNMGMGLNMLGLIAFYTASPFNLLVMLIPVAYITEAILLVTLLKFGLAGLLFAVYTDYVMDRRGLFALLFSTAWALCGYTVAYASNIMWLDGAAFLPLVLLGVERMLRENRCGLLLFSLCYIFFTSYYIAYMIGVFALLYLTAVWMCGERSTTRDYLAKVARLAGTALVAAGLCAFLLLPAFLNLKNGQSQMWQVTAPLGLERPFVRIAARMLPGVYDTLTDAGYPNIYVGVAGLLLCVLYFTHQKIPRREKLVFGGLLLLLLLSLSSPFLDLAWHAFEDPTWFPARYSFVVSFLVLYLAMRAACNLEGITTAGVLGALGGLLLLITEISVGQYPSVPVWSLLAGVGLLGLYALLWWLWRKGGGARVRRVLAPLLLVLLCAELGGNALAICRGLDSEFHYKSRAGYTDYREAYGAAVEKVQALDDGVYRLEMVEQRNANGGMALGYNGISHYSTTTDQELSAFLRRLGYNKGTENELRFAPSTPITGGLLGIKYVLSKEDMGPGYELVAQVGEIGVYQNSCAFPLAWWAGPDALEASGQGGDPFALQNELIGALSLGGPVFEELSDISYTLDNADRDASDGLVHYSRRVAGEDARIRFLIDNPSEQPAYAWFPVWKGRFSSTALWVDGAFVQQDQRYRRNGIVPLGDSSEIPLVVEMERDHVRVEAEYFYALDLPATQAAAEQAGALAMQFDRFGDTHVSGRVTAPQDGLLASSIPYDSGWRVRVDGARVKPNTFAGVFLAIELPEGEHRIEMRYYPPGFVAGCLISATSAVAVGLFFVLRRRSAVAKEQAPKQPRQSDEDNQGDRNLDT